MVRLTMVAAALLLGAISLAATAADLSPARAAAIESAFDAGRATPAERVQLLDWYASQAGSAEAAQIRDKRIALIAAMVQAGQSAAPVHRDGDTLASPEGYARIKALLLARAEKSNRPGERAAAIWFMFPEEPEAAFGIAAENGMLRDSAVMAAHYLLGIGRPPYSGGGDALGPVNQDARNSGFGRGLLQLVNETADPLFQFAFGDTLREMGARLYRAGLSEWDYRALANSSLARAAKAEPQELNCGFAPAVLPERNAIAEAGRPQVPAPTGTTFYALIGCSGLIASLEWIDGPPAGVNAAKRQLATRRFEVPMSAGQRIQTLQLVSVPPATRQ